MEFMDLQKTAALEELRGCNEWTAPFGLSLSDAQMKMLAENRFRALQNTGRVEFGEGILKKLIYAFCDSPFLTQETYEETISELQEIFYYFKNETEDKISDDELISFMKERFDNRCEGSVDLLQSRELEAFARGVRNGCDDFNEESDEDFDEEF